MPSALHVVACVTAAVGIQTAGAASASCEPKKGNGHSGEHEVPDDEVLVSLMQTGFTKFASDLPPSEGHHVDLDGIGGPIKVPAITALLHQDEAAGTSAALIMLAFATCVVILGACVSRAQPYDKVVRKAQCAKGLNKVFKGCISPLFDGKGKPDPVPLVGAEGSPAFTVLCAGPTRTLILSSGRIPLVSIGPLDIGETVRIHSKKSGKGSLVPMDGGDYEVQCNGNVVLRFRRSNVKGCFLVSDAAGKNLGWMSCQTDGSFEVAVAASEASTVVGVSLAIALISRPAVPEVPDQASSPVVGEADDGTDSTKKDVNDTHYEDHASEVMDRWQRILLHVWVWQGQPLHLRAARLRCPSLEG